MRSTKTSLSFALLALATVSVAPSAFAQEFGKQGTPSSPPSACSAFSSMHADARESEPGGRRRVRRHRRSVSAGAGRGACRHAVRRPALCLRLPGDRQPEHRRRRSGFASVSRIRTPASVDGQRRYLGALRAARRLRVHVQRRDRDLAARRLHLPLGERRRRLRRNGFGLNLEAMFPIIPTRPLRVPGRSHARPRLHRQPGLPKGPADDVDHDVHVVRHPGGPVRLAVASSKLSLGRRAPPRGALGSGSRPARRRRSATRCRPPRATGCRSRCASESLRWPPRASRP